MAKKQPTVAAILRRVRRYIEKGWTQGVFARSAKGRDVDYSSKRATCWCIRGAVNAAVRTMIPAQDNDELKRRWDIEDRVSGFIGRGARLKPYVPNSDTAYDIIEWNDKKGRTQDQILRAVDRAIAAAEKAGV